MLQFNFTLDGDQIHNGNDQKAVDAFFDEYCAETNWQDFDIEDKPMPENIRFVGEYHGIDVWYCFSDNYFFFAQ